MSKKGLIYGIQCPISNEVRYIGQTVQKPSRRLYKHIWITKKKKISGEQLNHRENWLWKIIESGLEHKIELITLEECSSEKLNEKEIFWIKSYKDNNASLVNSTNGGDTFRDEEFIKRLALLNKKLKTGNTYCKGKIHSKKTRKKISNAVLASNHPLWGKPMSEEIKKKISEANSGENNGMYGKRFNMSNKHKKKISKALKKSKKFQASRKSKEYRKKISDLQQCPVFVLDNFFKIIQEFKNMTEISVFLNCNPENVYNARRYNRRVARKYWIVYKHEYNEYIKKI